MEVQEREKNGIQGRGNVKEKSRNAGHAGRKGIQEHVPIFFLIAFVALSATFQSSDAHLWVYPTFV